MAGIMSWMISAIQRNQGGRVSQSHGFNDTARYRRRERHPCMYPTDGSRRVTLSPPESNRLHFDTSRQVAWEGGQIHRQIHSHTFTHSAGLPACLPAMLTSQGYVNRTRNLLGDFQQFSATQQSRVSGGMEGNCIT